MPSTLKIYVRGATLAVSEYPPVVNVELEVQNEFEYDIDWIFYYELSFPPHNLSLHYLDERRPRKGVNVITTSLIVTEVTLNYLKELMPKDSIVQFQLNVGALFKRLMGPRVNSIKEFSHNYHHIKEAMTEKDKKKSSGLMPAPVDQLQLGHTLLTEMNTSEQSANNLDLKLSQLRNEIEERFGSDLGFLFLSGGIDAITQSMKERELRKYESVVNIAQVIELSGQLNTNLDKNWALATICLTLIENLVKGKLVQLGEAPSKKFPDNASRFVKLLREKQGIDVDYAKLRGFYEERAVAVHEAYEHPLSKDVAEESLEFTKKLLQKVGG